MMFSFQTIYQQLHIHSNGLIHQSKSKQFTEQNNVSFSDEQYSNFEWNYFLTGTALAEETDPAFINLQRVRVPKLRQGYKNTIDYTNLDRNTFSAV